MPGPSLAVTTSHVAMLGDDRLTQLHDDLRGPVMPRLHDGAVVLVVECRAPEVDQPDRGALQDTHLENAGIEN